MFLIDFHKSGQNQISQNVQWEPHRYTWMMKLVSAFFISMLVGLKTDAPPRNQVTNGEN